MIFCAFPNLCHQVPLRPPQVSAFVSFPFRLDEEIWGLAILKSSQAQYLSEYERKEVLGYSAIYYIGANSKKKPATINNPSSNYGYDDDRGDYLVVNHDHLAYRYEIVDTLGKGSFGQVLHC